MAANSICAIDFCGKPALAKGFCSAHYWRFRRHGDPLAGRTRPGDPMRFIVEVALPFDGSECLEWPYGKNGHGYGLVLVDGKNKGAHRYLCEISHGLAPTAEHEAAHSCGNGHLGCVNPRHLSWKTPDGNAADKITHGTHNRGSRNNMAKLSEEEVLGILSMKGEKSQTAIAKIYGVSRNQVSLIHRGKSWGWVNYGTCG
ncbi:hypothetical protein RWA06_04625 [Sinorhizobium meliloti]|uniref:hypothetical protein n=1 Tax=Rhizobium meliloti TaxID=382 RepID=UPI00299DF3CA|nr:hypothetical protein [Sinorhizobium meliloti]